MKVQKTKFIANSLVLLAIACGFRNVTAAHEQSSDATVFKAESLLIVRRSVAPLIDVAGKTDAAEDRQYANTQKALLESPFVLAAALRQPEISELSLVKDQEEPLEWLAKNIQCEFVDDSGILRVSLSGKNPRELKVMVDAVVDSYLGEIVQAEKTRISQRLQTLRQHRRTNELAIREKAEIIKSLAEEVGSVDSNQVRLLKELNFHELKLLFDRRERLTSKMNDVSDELHVVEALSSENTDAASHELQKQTRVLKLRKEQLKARIDAVEARIADRRQELTRLVGFSADLEARKSDMMIRHKANHEIVTSIARMELELKDTGPVRVQLVQPAFVTKIHHDSLRRKEKTIQEKE